MLKKYLVCTLCVLLVLVSSISAFAEPAEDIQIDEPMQFEQPMQGGMGGRGGRGGGMGGESFENMTPPDDFDAMPAEGGNFNGGEIPEKGEQATPPQIETGTEESLSQVPSRGGSNMMPSNANFGGNFSGFDNSNMQEAEDEPMSFLSFVQNYQTPIISIVLLLAAFVFVKLYKRKSY